MLGGDSVFFLAMPDGMAIYARHSHSPGQGFPPALHGLDQPSLLILRKKQVYGEGMASSNLWLGNGNKYINRTFLLAMKPDILKS